LDQGIDVDLDAQSVCMTGGDSPRDTRLAVRRSPPRRSGTTPCVTT